MDKRGIGLSLSVLVGIILAISGAVLLAMVGSNLYSLIFPVTQVEASTEATILEFINLVELSEEYDWGFYQNYFPGQIHKKTGVIIFPRISRSVKDARGGYISKPPIKECIEKSCICIYDVSKQNCELPKLSKSPLLKCYGLDGIDFVVSPVTYGAILQGVTGDFRSWKFYDIGDNFIKIEAERLGTNIFDLNIARMGFAYMTMGMEQNYKWYEGIYDDDPNIAGLKMGYTDPIFRSRSCRGDSQTMGFYFDIADYGEKGVGIYLSSNFDPSIPFRKQAFQDYLSKQSGTT